MTLQTIDRDIAKAAVERELIYRIGLALQLLHEHAPSGATNANIDLGDSGWTIGIDYDQAADDKLMALFASPAPADVHNLKCAGFGILWVKFRNISEGWKIWDGAWYPYPESHPPPSPGDEPFRKAAEGRETIGIVKTPYAKPFLPSFR